MADVAPARSPGGGGGAAGASRDVSDGGGGDGEGNGGNGGGEDGVGCGVGVGCSAGGGGGSDDDKVAGGRGGAMLARGGRACGAGSTAQPLLSVLGSSMYGGGGDMSSRKSGEELFTNATTERCQCEIERKS